MIEKGVGGGNTITGLNFEKETDILRRQALRYKGNRPNEEILSG